MVFIPQIYNSISTDASDLLGPLPDAISCKATEERNGEFYLEMTYPAFGQNTNYIQVGNIIVAKTDPGRSGGQPFRIATIEKTLDGTMHITAYHVCYDLGNVIVMPFTANNLSDALDGLMDNGVPANDFYLSSGSWSPSGSFQVTKPTPLLELMAGTEGSIIDVFGGEYEFNNWDVYFRKNRGTDKNIQIAYGKNLTEFKETDELGAYDAVVPYAIYNETTYYLTDTGVCATAPVVPSSVSQYYPRTIAVDFSGQFTDTAPTQAQLLAAAQSYINSHSAAPTANYSTGFVDLSKLLGYTEEIRLCDTIHLSVRPYGVSGLKLKVIKTVYDCLLDEYESVQVGDKKVTLADTLAELMGAQK